jgi:hypothetical protein
MWATVRVSVDSAAAFAAAGRFGDLFTAHAALPIRRELPEFSPFCHGASFSAPRCGRHQEHGVLKSEVLKSVNSLSNSNRVV